MIVTTRVAIVAALTALFVAVCGCQPHRDAPAVASLASPEAAPEASATTPGRSYPTTRRADDSASPLEPNAVAVARTGAWPATGRRCRVHLRRDAMGLATVSPLPMSSRVTSPAVRAMQIEGVIDAAGDHWITLRTADRTYSLPVGSILAIEYLDDGR